MENDLISRSELLASFLSCTRNCENCNSFNEDTGNCSLIENAPTVEEVSIIEFKEPLPPVKAQKIIRALNKRPQGEWILVSERLPEQNGFYITTCCDICENRVHVVGFDGVRKKWGRGGVIAWQPLPEPYKKGGKE